MAHELIRDDQWEARERSKINYTFAVAATDGRSIGRRIVATLPPEGDIPAAQAADTIYDGLVAQVQEGETLLWGMGGTDWCHVGQLDHSVLRTMWYSEGTITETDRRDYPAFVVPTQEHDDYVNQRGHWATAEGAYDFYEQAMRDYEARTPSVNS